MNARKQYEHFWNVSSTNWCLLELESYIEGARNLLIFNIQNPSKVPMIPGRYLEAVKKEMLNAGVRIIALDEKLEDIVREYCRRKGFGHLVIYGTFDYLLKGWETTVSSIVSGKFPLSLDEYRNDMDGRKILSELIEVADNALPAGIEEQMWQLDCDIRKSLQPSSVCIWGTENSLKYGYSPHKHWYYFMIPKLNAEKWEQKIRE